jgi:polar amino acid transport system substrate-binding protein
MEFKISLLSILLFISILIISCTPQVNIQTLDDLVGMKIGVPAGTIADILVNSAIDDVNIVYFESTYIAKRALLRREIDAVAYNLPILQVLAARNPSLKILCQNITYGYYAFATNIHNTSLLVEVNYIIYSLKESSKYIEMVNRWFPQCGISHPPPNIELSNRNGVLRLGTTATQEPFSFIDKEGNITGFDIEIAKRIAQKMDKEIEIINMNFGMLIPSLQAGLVDIIGGCLTISEERAKIINFTTPVLAGGIAALVRR